MWTRVPECYTELGTYCDPETADWARWASTPHLLPLVLDVYLCVCAFIMCALELEINSRLLRDHMARPIEQSLAFLRVASGRGVFYCMTGLLAFDLRVGPASTHLTSHMLAGIAMLIFGAYNVAIGSYVALKLKRLRRRLIASHLVEAYRKRAEPDGLAEVGLHHAAARLLFQDLGVYFTNMQLQCVFLEIDADGSMKIDVAHCALLFWYYGHIGRQLKRHANPSSHELRHSSFVTRASSHVSFVTRQVRMSWVMRHDLGRYAVLVNVLLFPLIIVSIIVDSSYLQLPSLVIHVYMLVTALLMLIIELRIEVTRRTALHLLRYASAMMHPTARGVVYLVMALTLLSSWSDSGYLLEVLAFLHLLVGYRVSSKLSALRRALPDQTSLLAAFRHAATDGEPLSRFGLKMMLQMMLQAAGVPVRFHFELTALMITLDLDRDGCVSEDDLLYWLGTSDDL
eukprot:jgi/Chrpa1/18359/Chrysochromulina_OHIO_Genome00017869-RA